MTDKALVMLNGEIKTPPMSAAARKEAGARLRALQGGKHVAMPHSRPMPSIAPHCHELRIQDEQQTWRVIYRIDVDAVVVVDVFSKKTQQTPPSVIKACRQRLARYDRKE